MLLLQPGSILGLIGRHDARLAMAAIEAAIAKIFIDVAVSAGVDVLSKRAASPIVRGASRSYKVFTLISTIDGVHDAIRICAYADAARLIGQEVFVEVGSKPIARALLGIREANYEIHQKAERYLITPEFAKAEGAEPLARWLYSNHNFLAENLTRFGQPLAAQTATCVARAARSRDIAVELAAYAEARAPRRHYKFKPTPNWLDRVNSDLGYLLWQPVPEIGLGSRVVGEDATYSGIFRGNDAEGYGCITSVNGTRYYGQTRYGYPSGYGVFYFTDRSVYLGKVPRGDHQLGASIPPGRDWVYYGEHQRTTADGYGRRVGRANGVESVSALWREGKIESALQSLADVYRGIAHRMNGPYVQELRAENMQLAQDAERAIARNDTMVLSHLSRDL